jgi:hypothetical protein
MLLTERGALDTFRLEAVCQGTEAACMAQTCPTCSKSLADGTSVVFKDDKLIHARCWADRPVESTEEARKPPRTPSGNEARSKDAA